MKYRDPARNVVDAFGGRHYREQWRVERAEFDKWIDAQPRGWEADRHGDAEGGEKPTSKKTAKAKRRRS